MPITIGSPAPEIELTATGGKQLRLSDLKGRKVVLYFYPKASTPGCTQEGKDFAAAIEAFDARDTVILGASRDGIKAQENFKAKQGFPFDLISDTGEELCNAFDVIKMKNMYGKQVRGIERSTFLIDGEGVVRGEWRKVKVKDHVEEVLKAVAAL